MGHNRLYFGLFLVMFVAIAIIIIVSKLQKNPYQNIRSFADCQKAGYPVMQSDIRQCTLPSGKFFVEQAVPER